MELWIRSQDKKKLIKVNEIKIESVIDGNSFIYSHITDLGNYKTKERALEVLDEIGDKIAQNQALISLMQNFTDLKGNEEKISKLFKDMIYEMPEK